MTWLMQWDVARKDRVDQLIRGAEDYQGTICGMELHPDYSSRAIVMVRFTDHAHATRFGYNHHILNEFPIQEGK